MLLSIFFLINIEIIELISGYKIYFNTKINNIHYQPETFYSSVNYSLFQNIQESYYIYDDSLYFNSKSNFELESKVFIHYRVTTTNSLGGGAFIPCLITKIKKNVPFLCFSTVGQFVLISHYDFKLR
jgi:hypothetical protein